MIRRLIAVGVLMILMAIVPAQAAASVLSAKLDNIKNEFSLYSDIKKFDGKVGIYAKNLKTGKTFAYNENIVFPTASTSKLVVALAVYKYLYPVADGETRERYDNDIEHMITVSDNDAFYELLDDVNGFKFNAIDRVIRDLRLKKTLIHSEEAYAKYQYHSVTTPREMAGVFENIYWGKYLSKPKSEVMKADLANTIFQDEIPRYMMTKVMHKVGQLDDTLCDVGIVDDGKDQILISVYTISNREDSYASDFIAGASAKAYNLLRRK